MWLASSAPMSNKVVRPNSVPRCNKTAISGLINATATCMNEAQISACVFLLESVALYALAGKGPQCYLRL